MRYPLNKIIQTKKKHACGSNMWEVVKTGAEVRIKCQGCNKLMNILPSKLDGMIK